MAADNTTPLFGDLWEQLINTRPFFLMAGPNVIESLDRCLRIGQEMQQMCRRLGIIYIFKSSFDKANRTSINSYRGLGAETGLSILKRVRERLLVPIITDIHYPEQAALAAQVADIIQIPAFLCRQTDLLLAAGATGKIIHIKKGQFCAPEVMKHSVDKIRSTGNFKVMVCERGSMYGYHDLVVDPRSLVRMRQPGVLVTADVTHSLQTPATGYVEGGGTCAGGSRDLIPTIARTAVAVGVNGIFMEVHDQPDRSPCDAPTQWPLNQAEELLTELVQIGLVSLGLNS